MARDTMYVLYSTGRADPTYKNVWGFDSVEQRAAFLNGKSPLLFTAQKYWRVGTGIKCAVDYEASFKYDYVAITNNLSTQQRTYYCFIVGRVYVSNNVTQFILDVDYIQTYYFSADGSPWWKVTGFVTLGTDPTLPPRGTASEYPVPETEAYLNSVKYNEGYGYIIYSTIDIPEFLAGTTGYRGAVIDGVLLAAAPYLYWSSNTVTAANDIGQIVDKFNKAGLTDAISGIYAIPFDFVNNDNVPEAQFTRVDDNAIQSLLWSWAKPTNCGGYVPKNKQLLGYDYSYIVLNNGQGETSVWHFEDFYNDSIQFIFEVSLSAGYPVINMRPYQYRYGDNANFRQFSAKIASPMSCSYLNDSYKIWMAQTQSSRAAAMDGAQLALAHAQQARQQSFAVQLSTGYDGVRQAHDYNMFGFVGKGISDIADNPIQAPNLQWRNRSASNPIAQIGMNIVNAVGNATYSITNRIASGVTGLFNKRVQQVDSLMDSAANALNSISGGFTDWLGNLMEAGTRKMLGVEQAYVYDQAVENAQQGINALVASYRDKARIPATSCGSNAYGDLAKYQQYGFIAALYTPTAEWAQLIDLNLSAGGHTINKYMQIVQTHQVFDVVAAMSPKIPIEPDRRPMYVRNMMAALLNAGIYIWYYVNGDISPNIGMPYQIDNPEVI